MNAFDEFFSTTNADNEAILMRRSPEPTKQDLERMIKELLYENFILKSKQEVEYE